MAWQASNAASLSSLAREIDQPRTSDGRRVQIEQQITKIRADEPERDFAMQTVLRAWADLSTCRPIGMTVGPIPWTAIVQWAEFHDLDRDAAGILVHVIRQLDIERAESEASKQQKDKALGTGRARGRT